MAKQTKREKLAKQLQTLDANDKNALFKWTAEVICTESIDDINYLYDLAKHSHLDESATRFIAGFLTETITRGIMIVSTENLPPFILDTYDAHSKQKEAKKQTAVGKQWYTELDYVLANYKIEEFVEDEFTVFNKVNTTIKSSSYRLSKLRKSSHKNSAKLLATYLINCMGVNRPIDQNAIKNLVKPECIDTYYSYVQPKNNAPHQISRELYETLLSMLIN